MDAYNDEEQETGFQVGAEEALVRGEHARLAGHDFEVRTSIMQRLRESVDPHIAPRWRSDVAQTRGRHRRRILGSVDITTSDCADSGTRNSCRTRGRHRRLPGPAVGARLPVETGLGLSENLTRPSRHRAQPARPSDPSSR